MEPIQSTETLELQEDVLHLAGSKMSLKDVLDRQMEIPTYNGRRFYKTEDIAKVFVTMNGILTDVSKKAYSNKLRFEELQQELALKGDEVSALHQELEARELELSTMISTSEADVLRDRIHSLESEKLEYQQETQRMANDVQLQLDELTRILEETQAELQTTQAQLQTARDENTRLCELVDKTVDEALMHVTDDLEEKVRIAGELADEQIAHSKLQYEYDVLKDEYELLKEQQIISEMKHKQMYDVAHARVVELQQRLKTSG